MFLTYLCVHSFCDSTFFFVSPAPHFERGRASKHSRANNGITYQSIYDETGLIIEIFSKANSAGCYIITTPWLRKRYYHNAGAVGGAEPNASQMRAESHADMPIRLQGFPGLRERHSCALIACSPNAENEKILLLGH